MKKIIWRGKKETKLSKKEGKEKVKIEGLFYSLWTIFTVAKKGEELYRVKFQMVGYVKMLYRSCVDMHLSTPKTQEN